MTDQTFYGWYDDAGQPVHKPSFNPPFDAPCPYCGKPILPDDIRTHSLMMRDGYAKRSYFYRTHRSCDDSDPNGFDADAFILGMISRNGD